MAHFEKKDGKVVEVCGRCGGPHPSSACQIPEGLTPEIAQAEATQGGCCDPPKDKSE